jgi:hypothetical protein
MSADELPGSGQSTDADAPVAEERSVSDIRASTEDTAERFALALELYDRLADGAGPMGGSGG